MRKLIMGRVTYEDMATVLVEARRFSTGAVGHVYTARQSEAA